MDALASKFLILFYNLLLRKLFILSHATCFMQVLDLFISNDQLLMMGNNVCNSTEMSLS